MSETNKRGQRRGIRGTKAIIQLGLATSREGHFKESRGSSVLNIHLTEPLLPTGER